MISLVISLLLQSSFDHCQRASGSFANLRVVHHGIDVVRYPLLLVRTALEMEAGLLDSQVQEVLGAEEVTGRGLASGLQLQWAAQDEIPNVRLFELDCCAIPLTAAGGMFAGPSGAVGGRALGTQGGVLLTSCTSFVLLRELPTSRVSLRSSPKFQLEPPASVSPGCCTGRKMWRSRGNLCSVRSWFRGRRASALEHSSCEGSERQKDREAFGPKRGCGPSSDMEGFAGRLAALEVSGPAPIPTPYSSGPTMLEMHAASPKSCSPALHEARTLLRAGVGMSHIRLTVKPVCAVPSQKRCAFLPTARSRRGTCKVGFRSGQTQKRKLVGGVRSGCGSGDN